MFGEMAVKHMAMHAKRKPPTKEKGMMSKEEGSSTSLKTAITASIILALIRLLVAPHRISPVITSSMLRGVAIIASKVF